MSTSNSNSNNYVTISHLRKGYGQGDSHVEVLHDINVTVARGEVCVLFGPSGSGKSTFLNLLGGLEPADAGTISVNGTELTTLKDNDLVEYRRRELGFVFQFPIPVDDLLHRLGLWEHRAKFPNQVSGGQQQRCAIGRALAKRPGLLLCDEPTGALDYKTSKEILCLLEDVNREFGCTMVIVTHNDAIRHMSHHILRLRDGQLVEDELNPHVMPAAQIEW